MIFIMSDIFVLSGCAGGSHFASSCFAMVERAREGHGEIRLGALCRQGRLSPKSAPDEPRSP